MTTNPMTALQLARVAKEANGDCFFENKPVFVREQDGQLRAAAEFRWDEQVGGFVIATGEVKPPLPPEPGPLAVVRDRHGMAWQREAGTGSPDWLSLGDHKTWQELNADLGPLTLLVPDPADDAPVRQLIDAALAWVSYVQKASSPPSMWADTHDFKLIEAGDAYLAAREVETP